MEYAPPPRDPEGEARGHELRDVAIRPILFFLIGLIVFGGVLQAVMSTIMTGYVKQDTARAAPSMDLLRDNNGAVGDAPPPLQRDTTADMIRMYDDEDAVLASARVDPKTKKVRIPIDRAIELVAKKGLPHRDSAPKSAVDPEPSYSEKARAYRATK